MRVVEKEGVSALSLYALARKAGVTSGAPYHHFESREELLAAIALEGYERLVAAMKRGAEEAEAEASCARGTETTAEAHLRGLGRGYVRFALAHPGYFRIMFRPELKMHVQGEEPAAIQEAFGLLYGVIARCQEEGTIPDGDPKPLVLLAWSAVHGASVLWIDGPLSDKGLVEGPDSLGPAIADTLVELLRKAASGVSGALA